MPCFVGLGQFAIPLLALFLLVVFCNIAHTWTTFFAPCASTGQRERTSHRKDWAKPAACHPAAPVHPQSHTASQRQATTVTSLPPRCRSRDHPRHAVRHRAVPADRALLRQEVGGVQRVEGCPPSMARGTCLQRRCDHRQVSPDENAQCPGHPPLQVRLTVGRGSSAQAMARKR